jgi:DNA (cytosine-5)-methyltransferase 1
MTTPPLTAVELQQERRAVEREVAARCQPHALVACAGFGLSSIPIAEAGYAVTGIELDDASAAVNRANGGDCITADFTAVDPRQFGGIELFQISPPCQSFSQAKTDGKETETDITLARQTCRYIRTLKPKFFLLENVWLYRKSESWRLILHCLKQTGYKVGFWRLCSADYGTPQTRHRMIVVARRDGVRPHKPFQTHRERETRTVVYHRTDGTKETVVVEKPDMFCQRWNGWLEAIADLVPYLPDSEFAPWHKARMPDELLQSIMIGGGNTNIAQPSSKPRQADEPAFTAFASNEFRERAFIVDGKLNDGGERLTCRDGENPIFTVTASGKLRDIRAFIADQLNSSRPPTIRLADEPAPTLINYCAKHPGPRANIEGRTVSMIPRCYARWQGLHDGFGLPATKTYRERTGQFLAAFADEFTPGNVDNGLTCRGIGNGVPLELMRAVMRTLLPTPTAAQPGHMGQKGGGR